MSESLTDSGAANTAASTNEPTVAQQPVTNSAESTNQETNPGSNTQGSVSDDTANQSQQNTENNTNTQTGGESSTDDGLAKFAQSQGFDLTTAGEDVKRALKIAHDNQKAFRSKPTQSIADATQGLGGTSVEAQVAELKYERDTERFFSAEGRDRSLESKMVEILAEKKEQHGPDYAFQLSRDMDTLYGLAQLRNQGSGAQAPVAPVDADAIRREERESINRNLSAGAPAAHAVQNQTGQSVKIDSEWIRTQYDSRNPEHRKMVDAFYQQK